MCVAGANVWYAFFERLEGVCVCVLCCVYVRMDSFKKERKRARERKSETSGGYSCALYSSKM